MVVDDEICLGDKQDKKEVLKKEPCVICGVMSESHIDGVPYCNKHYLRIRKYGTPVPKFYCNCCGTEIEFKANKKYCDKCAKIRHAARENVRRKNDRRFNVNDLHGEVWKDIHGYDGKYKVSNFGRIKYKIESHPIMRDNKVEYVESGWKLMKPSDNGRGYLSVTLSNSENGKTEYVHRIVAESFCKNDKKYDTVNHKDFNRKNNRADNLEWVSQRDNLKYSIDAGRYNKKEKLYNIRRVCKKYEVRIMRNNVSYAKTFDNIEDAIKYRDEIIRNA